MNSTFPFADVTTPAEPATAAPASNVTMADATPTPALADLIASRNQAKQRAAADARAAAEGEYWKLVGLHVDGAFDVNAVDLDVVERVLDVLGLEPGQVATDAASIASIRSWPCELRDASTELAAIERERGEALTRAAALHAAADDLVRNAPSTSTPSYRVDAAKRALAGLWAIIDNLRDRGCTLPAVVELEPEQQAADKPAPKQPKKSWLASLPAGIRGEGVPAPTAEIAEPVAVDAVPFRMRPPTVAPYDPFVKRGGAR